MVWTNQNFLKNDDWQDRILFEDLYVTGDYVHTFTIHATDRAGVVQEKNGGRNRATCMLTL